MRRILGIKNALLDNKILASILLVTAVLVFFRITQVDLMGDDAHYSARSVGLVDYMFADPEFQSTPLQWFARLPWWSYLSFHDHPELLFIIQHVFLMVRVSIFFAKLPYALMTLGLILVTYGWCQRLFGRTAALLAAALLALNAHVIWYGRTALMESGVLFFISLALYYFFRYLEDERQRWKFGLFLGLALETKLTTLFLIPTVLAYALIRRRLLFRRKTFYLAAALAFVVFSPFIIYNLEMYHATGHFALQLARLMHENSPWHLSGISSAPVGSFAGLPGTIGGLISFPYLAVFLTATVYDLAFRKETLGILLGLFFFLIEDRLVGAHDLYGIFIAPLTAVFLVDVYGRVKTAAPRWLAAYTGFVTAFLAYLFVFVIQSHLVVAPRGPQGWAYSSELSKNFGMIQLDQYLNTVIAGDQRLSRLEFAADLKRRSPGLSQYALSMTRPQLEDTLNHANVILFDGNIDWFERVWLFERRRFYYNLPLLSLNEKNLVDQIHLNSFYFIKVTTDGPLDSGRNQAGYLTEQNIIATGNKNPVLIYRDDGKVAYKIYYVTSKQGA